MFRFNMFSFGQSHPFRATYLSYPVAMLAGNEREDVERGGKIIMPPSALQSLSNSSVSYPMMFKLVNPKIGRSTHCGVLEFVADEGRVYLPLWMMQNLMLEEGVDQCRKTGVWEQLTLPSPAVGMIHSTAGTVWPCLPTKSPLQLIYLASITD